MFVKAKETSSENVKPSYLQHDPLAILPASVVERTLYFMSSENLTNTSCLVTEGSAHTSSAGRGGMLNLGLVKKAIFSLQANKTYHVFILKKSHDISKR